MIRSVLPVGDPFQQTPRLMDATGDLGRGQEEQLVGRIRQTGKTSLFTVFFDPFPVSGVRHLRGRERGRRGRME